MDITEEQIIKVLDDWNFWNNRIDIGFPRQDYLDRLKRYLKTDEVVTISGVRRSGKTTILMQLLDYLINEKGVKKIDTLYVNLEDQRFFPFLGIELLTKIYDTYIALADNKGKKYLVFDEIQKIDGWEHFIRSLHGRKENVKIFITGSSSRLLSSEFSTLLTGRHIGMKVFPLGFKEFLLFNGVSITSKLDYVHDKSRIINLSRKFIVEGGFPKIVLTKDKVVRSELLSQYFNDIIVKDISERYRIRDPVQIKNIGLYYSTNVSELASYHSIKNALGQKSTETVERFTNYLESAFLIFSCRRFSYSLKKQLANLRKIYFIDNGLRNAVSFQFKDMYGNLLENAAYLELIRAGNDSIFYYRGKQETDFVMQVGLKVKYLINCCYDMRDKKTEEREVRALLESMEYFKLDKAYIITLDEERIIDKGKKKIYVIPFHKLCLYGLKP